MRIKRGDVIWLSEELSINLGKNVQDIKRPYVVISNNKNNDHCPTINIACLTNQDTKANYPMHVFLNKNDYKYLYHNSVICAEQVLTVNKNEIIENMGSLNEKDLKKLNEAIYIQLIDENKRGLKI